MNLICIPFAYEENMNSGVNVSIKGKGKIEIYLKNACVALISAKYYNPDSDVALVTNFGRWNIPEEFLSIFDKWEIKVMEIPFDQFRFQGSYTWALAFYKLCVLKKLSCMKYESICYMDTDVYIQGSFDAIWTECRQNIMLYDINHGLNTRDYVLLCDEIESYCGQRKLITHYGGEFFAASAENAKAFVDTCEQVYYEMLQKNFITTKGDEFILSLAANEMRESIKNAGAYIYRFWTGAGFRLISTCYEYNRITILHLPAEKEQGMLKIYDKYIKIGKIPVDEKVWKTFRLNRIPFRSSVLVVLDAWWPSRQCSSMTALLWTMDNLLGLGFVVLLLLVRLQICLSCARVMVCSWLALVITTSGCRYMRKLRQWAILSRISLHPVPTLAPTPNLVMGVSFCRMPVFRMVQSWAMACC